MEALERSLAATNKSIAAANAAKKTKSAKVLRAY
jgi:hypothetical protein